MLELLETELDMIKIINWSIYFYETDWRSGIFKARQRIGW